MTLVCALPPQGAIGRRDRQASRLTHCLATPVLDPLPPTFHQPLLLLLVFTPGFTQSQPPHYCVIILCYRLVLSLAVLL